MEFSNKYLCIKLNENMSGNTIVLQYLGGVCSHNLTNHSYIIRIQCIRMSPSIRMFTFHGATIETT